MPEYILPLKAPNPLPATNVTIVTFKVWKNTLVAHLQQDPAHFHFMGGGRYSTWIPSETGRQIVQLVPDDPDLLVLQEKLATRTISQANFNSSSETLLAKRNAQLAKFITHVATLVHYTEHDDISMQSSSLEWIFSYLKKHYGLETKGDHCGEW